jgi:hypothetical protein
MELHVNMGCLINRKPAASLQTYLNTSYLPVYHRCQPVVAS